MDEQNSRAVLSAKPTPETIALVKRNEAKIKPLLIKARLGMTLLESPFDDAYLASKTRDQIIELAACLYHFQLFTNMGQTLSTKLPPSHEAKRSIDKTLSAKAELVKDGLFEAAVEQLLDAAGFKNKMLAVTLIMTRVRNEWQEAKLLHTSITDSVLRGPAKDVLVTAFSSTATVQPCPSPPPADLD